MKHGSKPVKMGLCPQSLLVKIAVGYTVMACIIGGIAYVGIYEWREMKTRQAEVRRINRQKQDIHEVYVQMLELSLSCETFTEWDETDFKAYRKRRLKTDTLLCGLKNIYPNAHIDSVRYLWEGKEQFMRQINGIMHRQEEAGRKIAEQIPAIVRQSTREQAHGKEGFLKKLFKKNKTSDHPSSTSMLHALNREVVDRQQKYTRQLYRQADSLAARNRILNRQIEQMLKHMDKAGQEELRQREEKIAEASEHSLAVTAGLTMFMLLLLGVSYVVIHRDMSHINRYKKRLEETIEQLKRTIAENEELIAARKRLMLTMTHDLRTPLATISSYAELLATEKKAAKRKEYNRTIRRVAEHMVSMLNSLLGFFRLESGKEEINPVPFRLHAITETLEADFLPLAVEKNLSLNTDSGKDRVVIGDKKRIIQIGYNLLSNAIKFTAQGTVTLRMRFENEALRLSVEDTGTGIDEEEQARIFTAFERLPNAVAEEGVGLGLSIVKSLVGLLDGKIELTSRQGIGSCFTVTLPLSVTEEAIEKEEEMAYIQPFTVLALDNDTVLLASVKDMFARHGVMCTTCGNVRDMIERIRHQNYDLLITDLRMPQMNGFDVLKLLRIANVGNSQTIPVIAATAASNCNINDLRKAGFSACLSKPFSAEELMQVSTECLGNKRQQEQVDFHSLLEYGNRQEMLDTLIQETAGDMKAMAASAEKNDREALKEWTHHLSSSWEIIHAGKPLRELFVLLQCTQECSTEELGKIVQKVLDKGEEIIRLAQQAKAAYESDCC